MRTFVVLILGFAGACAQIFVHERRSRTRSNEGTESPNITTLPVNDPLTNTPAGLIRGSWMRTRRGRLLEAYRGIRYAEPPVGNLRFEPPHPILHYWREVNATTEGPACPQPISDNITTTDEDCLRLNVYTPNLNRRGYLPVLVFIHPGGFYSWSGRSDVVGPHYLLDRDVVLVTINYRLASLGFLSTGDEVVPGNNGFKDQVVALKWVRRNIAAFGGNPDLVTIQGYSAGSISVALHQVSPMSRGLFHRAISMSASPYSQVAIETGAWRLAARQAQLVGCPHHSSRVLVDCLRTVPVSDIANNLGGFAEFAFDPVLIWTWVVEPDFGQERFLPDDPLVLLRHLQPVPNIVSQTRDELFWMAFTVLNNATLTATMNAHWPQIAPISFLLPRHHSDYPSEVLKQCYLADSFPLRNDSVTRYGLGKLYGDSSIGFAAHRLANLMNINSPMPVFYYMFDYMGNHSFYEDPVTRRPVGVAHHDDLIYLFSIPLLFPDIQLGSPDSIMVDKMTAIIYNFMRFGNPNPQPDTPELNQLRWPAMSPKARTYIRISKDFSIHLNQAEERFRIWEQLYPIDYHIRPKFLEQTLSFARNYFANSQLNYLN